MCVSPQARSPTSGHTRSHARTHTHTHITHTTHFTKHILLPVLDSAAHLPPPALTAPLTTLYLTTLPASCIYFKTGCEDWMAPGIRCAAEPHILWFKSSFWHCVWRTWSLQRCRAPAAEADTSRRCPAFLKTMLCINLSLLSCSELPSLCLFAHHLEPDRCPYQGNSSWQLSR